MNDRKNWDLTRPPEHEIDPKAALAEFLSGKTGRKAYIQWRIDHADHIEVRLPEAAMGAVRQTNRDRWKKRPAVVRYREFADRLRAAAGKLPPAEQVTRVEIEATFEPPQSWSKVKRVAAMGELHRSKPDADNLAKTVLDSLWENDQAIADLRVTKSWNWEALTVIRIYINLQGATTG